MFEISTMTRDEIDFAVDLAAIEGWNPGLQDADSFYAADNRGFLIGKLNGQPIGCISAVSYENQFGFIGFYIVIPEFRGKGFGIRLWDAAMKRLEGHNIGLDGVIEQQDNYRKSGFKFCYSNIRFECLSPQGQSPGANSLVPLDTVATAAIESYDRVCFPAARTRFLDNWINLPESHGLAYQDQGQLRGYGVIRPCRQGFKVGPLFADDGEVAQALFSGLCSNVDTGVPIYFDVPEVNRGGLDIVERHGMQKVFETARMYTGDPPPIALDKVFGVTTFELG